MITEHNQKIRDQYNKLIEDANEIRNQVIAPCMECPYDGVFRCEACAENFYEGFNTKDYPK